MNEYNTTELSTTAIGPDQQTLADTDILLHLYFKLLKEAAVAWKVASLIPWNVAS